MGHRQVTYTDWFVLDLTGRHRLVLVQIEWTRNDTVRGLLGRLVAAWRSRVLIGVVWVILVLKLACSAAATSAPTTTSTPAPSSTRCQTLGLLGGYQAAGEQLGVFDGVCRQVNLQAGSVCVTTVTKKLTCPPAARWAKINASLPGGRIPPTLLIICLLFLPRFDGVGMTTAGETVISSFLSGRKDTALMMHQYTAGFAVMPEMVMNWSWILPVFEGCIADTIMVVAVGGPVTNDCVEAVGTSVP
ncbi:hypothetical protein XENOCAPTIV_000889 [Xenoophorus captivus]|uniref:Uncharacterized protein n=1 Tax=Xenoophorus captivus TaxID=1517983 RepID=A0ABV0RYG5_9TELE